MDPPSLLVIEDLAFGQSGPFSLTLERGECVGMSGPSGSGKTRLLRAVADLDVHTGRMWLDGIVCEDTPAPAWRRRVGLLPAESAWWYDEVGPHFATAPATDRLEALGFDQGVLSWRVDRLSSGERQRLAVLRLLSVEPLVVLLDEPTANLDEDNAAKVESLICEWLCRRQAAAVWVGHDPHQLRRVTVRSYRMHQGQLVEMEAAA